MKTIYLLLVLFCNLQVINSDAQNLIPNGSFEDSIETNQWFTSFKYCKLPWDVALFKRIDNSVWDEEGYEYKGFVPFDGNNCISIQLFVTENHFSQYIIVSIPPLHIGKTYNLTFNITASDSCGYAVDNIDALFCNSKYLKQNISCLSPQKIYVSPTLSFNIAELKKQNSEGNWLRMEASFVANGDENLLAIGNFSNDKKEKYWSKRKIGFKRTYEFNHSLKAAANYYLDNFALVLVK
jgi:hypothetical protein